MKYLLAAGILFSNFSAFAMYGGGRTETKSEISLDELRGSITVNQYIEIRDHGSLSKVRFENNSELTVNANYLAVMRGYCDSMSIHKDHYVVVCLAK